MHKTQDYDKQNKNTTQYVLDTPIHKTQDKDKQNKNTKQYCVVFLFCLSLSCVL
jgi:hypothetical protein